MGGCRGKHHWDFPSAVFFPPPSFYKGGGGGGGLAEARERLSVSHA